MARDYAKKDRPAGKGAAAPRQKAATRKAPKPKRSAPAHRQHGSLSLKWVLSLAAVGGFIGFIVYLNTLPAGPEAPKQAAPAQQQASPAATKAKQDAARQKEQNFRFYEMLPESEVVPPKVQEYTPGPAKTAFDYILQSGACGTSSVCPLIPPKNGAREPPCWNALLVFPNFFNTKITWERLDIDHSAVSIRTVFI